MPDKELVINNIGLICVILGTSSFLLWLFTFFILIPLFNKALKFFNLDERIKVAEKRATELKAELNKLENKVSGLERKEKSLENSIKEKEKKVEGLDLISDPKSLEKFIEKLVRPSNDSFKYKPKPKQSFRSSYNPPQQTAVSSSPITR